MAYNFTKCLKRDYWEVHVDPVAEYGYFEFVGPSEDLYIEGGLWFEGNELMDFDGRAMLPYEIICMLRSMGFTVSDDFV